MVCGACVRASPLTPDSVGFSYILLYPKKGEDVSQKRTDKLDGAHCSGRENEEGLVWSDNCGSEGQMTFSEDASKCRCLSHHQWVCLHT